MFLGEVLVGFRLGLEGDLEVEGPGCGCECICAANFRLYSYVGISHAPRSNILIYECEYEKDTED